MRVAILLFFLALTARAASLPLEWDTVPGADLYILLIDGRHLYVGPNNFYTVTNLNERNSYRFQVAALTNAGGSEPSDPLSVTFRPVTLTVERATSLNGPWRGAATNTAFLVETGGVFYRGKMGF